MVGCCVGGPPQKEKVDLIILGKQSIDSDNGQTGQVILFNPFPAMPCHVMIPCLILYVTVYAEDTSRLAELVAVHVLFQLDLFR